MYRMEDTNRKILMTQALLLILSFLVQNVNPINLDRKFDNENERLYVRMLWDKCLPHAITRFIYLSENYNMLGDPKLTYQKANTGKCLQVNSVNVFGIKNKNDFDFVFQSWRARRQNGRVGPKIINELPTPTNQLLVTKMLSKTKDPKDYQKRTVYKSEQAPLGIETIEVISNAEEMLMQPPIAPAPKYMKDRVDGSARKTMDVSKRAEKKIDLQRQLSENTAKMAIIKKTKIA